MNFNFCFKLRDPNWIKGSIGDATPVSGFLHVQVTPSATWTVTHNLNNYVFPQVRDSVGDILMPVISRVDKDEIIVEFPNVLTGSVYCFVDAVHVYTESSATTWAINHNIGIESAAACWVSDVLQYPNSEINTDLDNMTITWPLAQAGTAVIVDANYKAIMDSNNPYEFVHNATQQVAVWSQDSAGQRYYPDKFNIQTKDISLAWFPSDQTGNNFCVSHG